MNYLAHLFLAGKTPESLLGNLSGDFVKGALGDRFTPGIRQGIMEHRRIDEYTDTHPSIAALRRVIGAEHGHYSRVISDMFLDHFLSSDWQHYSLEDRDDFLRRIFGTLDPLIAEMPGHLRLVYPRMRDGRWLQSYIDPRGIETALRNLSHRFSRKPHLETATHLLEDERETLRGHATEFFPDVIAFAKQLR